MRMRATRMSAVRHAGGRRLSATALAIQAMRASGRNGLLSPLPTEQGFAFKDRGLTQPLVYPYDLEQQALAVIPANAVPPGVRPWSLGPDLLGGAGEFNSATGWTLSPGITISGGRLTSASSTNGAAAFTLPGVAPGKVYVATVSQTSYSSGSPFMTIGQGPNTPFGSAFFGTRTFFITAGSADSVFRIYSGQVGVGGSQVFESITVQEVIYDWIWLGPNLVTNGDNEGSAVTTTVIQRGTVTRSTERAQQGAASAKYTCTSPSAVNADHLVGLRLIPAGVTVLIDMWVYVPTGSFASVRAVDFNDGSWLSTNVTAKDQWVRIREVRYKAAPWTLAVGALAQTSSTDFSYFIDSITVQEIPVGVMIAPTAGGKRMSARVNLLQRTEDLTVSPWINALSGTGIAPTVSSVAGVSPNGTSATRVQLSLNGGTTSSDIVRRCQAFTPTAVSHRYSIWLRSFDGTSTYNVHIVGAGAATSNVVVTGAWTRYEIDAIGTGASVNFSVGLRGGQTPANSNTADILVWGADLRLSIYTGSAYPAYQRVGDGTAGVFDYDHVGFPVLTQIPAAGAGLYSVGLLDLTATDALRIGTVAAKLSDTVSVMAELSANANTTNGTAYLVCSTAGWQVSSRGTSQSVTAGTGMGGVRVDALNADFDISSDQLRLTATGVLHINGAGDQGTGNYGAHRYYDGGRALDGTASLPATNVRQVGWFADIADANAIDETTWAGMLRERAAVVGLTY